MTLSGRRLVAVLALLAVSLSLNFAGLGFLASKSVHGRPDRMSAERLVSIGAKSLPEPLRDKVAEALQPKSDEIRTTMRSVREARRAVFDAMRADPFDRARLEAAFAGLRDRLDALSAIGQQAIAEGLETATPEQRLEIRAPSGPKADRKPREGSASGGGP